MGRKLSLEESYLKKVTFKKNKVILKGKIRLVTVENGMFKGYRFTKKYSVKLNKNVEYAININLKRKVVSKKKFIKELKKINKKRDSYNLQFSYKNGKLESADLVKIDY